MQPKAILFDLDGTLVDSVPLWIEANIHTLKSFGVTMEPENFLKEIYHAGLHYRGILEHCGIDTKHAERFYSDRNDLFAELLRKNVRWIGDAERTLRQCAALAPLGMLTAAKLRFIEAMDERLTLSSLFSAIITADDTMQHMKPDPYGLLLLTERLKVAPEHCIYVGDQGVDVEAAKKAGMLCCLLNRVETPQGAEKDATMVIDKIEDLLPLLNTDNASEAWVKTIDEGKGYGGMTAAEFRKLIDRMPGYAFFGAVIRYVHPGQSVLEAGCGYALTSFALAGCGVHATALDISEKLIKDLQRLKQELGSPYAENLMPVVGDIFRLPELNTMFDAVVSDGTYEHFLQRDDRRKILEGIRSVLKENGVVIIAVPNLRNPFFGSVVDERMPAMHPFTLKELASELQEGGFHINETGYSFVNPGFAQWVQSRWMIGTIRLCDVIFRFLPKPLKRIFAAHLYCVARKT